nr:mechanosensitive ion channel family protein [Candidatus Eremiobacteraeota bacterium]
VQSAAPAMWVTGRQFTGRIVSVSNSVIFTEPVYNYSRDFPLIWEEMTLPIAYSDDRTRAEHILLDVAESHTKELRTRGQAAIQSMMRSYAMPPAELTPRVFYRITDNWLELGLRFVAPAHGARELKDAMSRDILGAFDEAGIGIASATYDIVGMPPLRVAVSPADVSTKGEAP